MKKTFEYKTRKVFHKIHKEQKTNRLLSLTSTNYLKLDNNYFKDKVCLVAGCGSNGNEIYGLLKQGAKKVYGFDLNKTIFEIIPSKLKEFEKRYELSVDNVLHTKYPDNFFDFVYCRGVLHHTGEKIFVGLEELKRITKKGGIIYFCVDGKGGIIDDFIDVLRKRYRLDNEFKMLIDELDENYIRNFFNFILSNMNKKDDYIENIFSKKFINKMFDKELILTIKDRIQAPVYTKTSINDIMDWLKKNNFTDIVRLKKYMKYSNIRKFLSPLYYNYNSEYSKLLYGDGVIEIRCKK